MTVTKDVLKLEGRNADGKRFIVLQSDYRSFSYPMRFIRVAPKTCQHILQSFQLP